MFSRYLIGEVEGGISLMSLVPCSATLPESFGKARIKVTGNYPFGPKIGIRFETASNKKFPLEFRNPAGARLTSARLNGEGVKLTHNARGCYEITRAWKTGDKIEITFEFLLKSHIETPKDDQRWVAFTYGPWALAQKLEKGAVVADPFIGKDVQSKAASEWLEPGPPQERGALRFRVKNSNILLEPFYRAGSKDAGPRTYFKF